MMDKYISLITAGIEEPHVDFKRAMSWSSQDECQRLELLTDIAAMCTYGGGVLIIGRDDEDKHSGSLTAGQKATFEPTKVNEYARKFLRPLPPIRVVPIDYNNDLLIVLDVPGFTETPPCFQEASQCSREYHRGERRHFSRGDVFTRTTASQTTRLADPADWQNVWKQVVRNVRNTVTFETEQSNDEADLYELEYEEDLRGHRLPFGVPDTTGRLEISLRPAEYIADRIPRFHLKEIISATRARVIPPTTNIASAMPYEETELQNSSRGIVLVNNHPEWKHSESGILRTSGSLKFRRIFASDFNENNVLDGVNLRLPLIRTAIELTLALSFASRLASSTCKPEEVVNLAIGIRGLANRRVEDDSIYFGARIPVLLATGQVGHPSNEPVVDIRRRLTVSELVDGCRFLAIEAYQELLWIFGIEPSTATVQQWQDAFRETGAPPTLISGA